MKIRQKNKRDCDIDITLNKVKLKEVKSYKYLGITLYVF